MQCSILISKVVARPLEPNFSFMQMHISVFLLTVKQLIMHTAAFFLTASQVSELQPCFVPFQPQCPSH